MIAITPYQLRRPSPARPAFGTQRRHTRRPYRGVRQNAGDVAQPQCRDVHAQIGVGAITGIHQHNPVRQAGPARRTNLLERNLRLGLEADLLGHTRLVPAFAVLRPFFRQIQTIGHRQAGMVIGNRQRHRDLADRMFVAREVARPAVCDERGLRRMGRRRASRIGRRAMQQNSKIYVGLDTSKLKISVAVAEEGRDGEVRFIGDIDSAPDAVERLVTKLAKRHRQLAFCYEAGPTGYGLHRQITQLGHECIVVAPSLIPKRSGERVKTNRRDALTLAKMHRAGELTAVWVPDPGHEAVRELVRAREAAMEDLRRTRQHLQSFLLRHGRIFTGRSAWTNAHTRWLCEQSFDHRAQYLVLAEYRQAIENAETRLKHLTGQVVEVVASWSMAPVVAAYQALRGVAFLTAVTFVAEIGDVRRFNNPRQLMAYLGLVPSEKSTGERVWRGKITKAGNSRARRVLIEGAWTYRFPARMSRLLQERQAGLTKVVRDIAWKAQLRLCSRYRKLMARGKRQTVVTVAIAREMSAFLWAIGQEVEPHPVA